MSMSPTADVDTLCVLAGSCLAVTADAAIRLCVDAPSAAAQHYDGVAMASRTRRAASRGRDED